MKTKMKKNRCRVDVIDHGHVLHADDGFLQQKVIMWGQHLQRIQQMLHR